MTGSLRGRLLVACAIVTSLGACGSGDDGSPHSTGLTGFEKPAPGTIGAQVANYELLAARPQRFRVGLVTSDNRLIGFGQVKLHFAYLGTKDEPIEEPEESMKADGEYLLVAGQEGPFDSTGPRLIAPSEGFGVYGAPVTFDDPGYWAVLAVAEIDGERQEATANFEVYEKPFNPSPGDAAPRTDNRMLTTPGVEPSSIDSRATNDGTIPDPELHAITIADALDTGKPLMVVVSTPTYCISRFCGPITETVQELAGQYGNEVTFVHVEVWNDYEKQAINREAAEWIYGNTDALSEPWVFLVGSDGTVIDRWDNVVTDTELKQALDDATAASGPG